MFLLETLTISIIWVPLRFRLSYLVLLLLMLKPGLPLHIVNILAAWLLIVSGLLHLEGGIILVISLLIVEPILAILVHLITIKVVEVFII